MSFSTFSPEWFFGYDVALEFLFAIILLAVAIFAFRAYKLTEQKQLIYFSLSFLFIGISYIIESIFNYMTITKLNATICQAVKIKSVALFDLMGIYTHMFFMTIGLVLLVYMTFKVEEKRPLWLLLIVSLVAIFFSWNKLLIFFLLSSIYLLFLVAHFFGNCIIHKTANAFMIASAFFLLFISHLHFIFALNSSLFYFAGHILELFAYLLILLNLVLLKNEKKKRSS
ncbi:hypothetical protein HN865_01140 [Candidatus Woesearchaeota archaeon]|jgi:hypothetical protein|nr:hypothetical protein [Candidatus Woesearchaeota archaeon]MBT7237441.1 hypothetical protein [Candidatus Woesearchaeota archaeon]